MIDEEWVYDNHPPIDYGAHHQQLY